MNADDILHEVLTHTHGYKPKKQQTKYMLPGKGRKECPACHAFVGVRTLTCVCGHEFLIGQSVKSEEKSPEATISDEDRRYALAVGCAQGARMVYAGAGPCPAKIKEPYTVEAINQFCEDVVSAGVPQKKLYMQSAIKHWLASVVDVETEVYLQLADMVDDWYDGKVASTMNLEI